MPRTLHSFMTQIIPGQDSNDIFDLQARQFHVNGKDYTKPNENETLDVKARRKLCEFEDIKLADNANNATSVCRRSLSEGKLHQDPSTRRSPPVAVGKENIGTHFKGCLSPRVSVNKNVDKNVEISEEESSGDEASSGRNSKNKPASKKEIESQSRLVDNTNLARVKDTAGFVTEKQAGVLELKKPRRPCIKVREPPGGKSSIVFH